MSHFASLPGGICWSEALPYPDAPFNGFKTPPETASGVQHYSAISVQYKDNVKFLYTVANPPVAQVYRHY